jgi:hypothetical protein
MTEPTVPPPATPPPAASPAKKKGLSPLAWVGIGCGALVLIAIIVFAAGVMFVGKKARDLAGDFESNPAMAAAKLAVQLNPELEVVESDEEAGTLTVRNKKTGEVLTLDLEEIEQGKLGVLTGEGKEATVTFGGAEGGVEIEAEQEGTTSRLRFGAGAGADDIPSWVPIYPGTEPASNFTSTTDEGTQGAFSLSTSDAPDEVLDWYAEEVQDLGMTPERSTFSTPASRGGLISGEAGGRQLNVTVMSQAEGTLVTVTFSDKG